MAIFMIITFMGRERISGLMVESSLATGEITKCMAEGCLSGVMAEGMRDSTSMIKRKVLALLNGKLLSINYVFV